MSAHFSAVDDEEFFVVEGSGWRGRRESDSQVFCHPNSMHAWWHIDKDMSLTSRPHHHHHQAFDSNTRFLVCVTVMFLNPADGSCADRAHVGSARRRRERQLRSWLKHERQTVAMELAAALHHSRDGGRVSNYGLRAPKTASPGKRPGVLKEPVPPVVVEHAACPCSGAPLLAIPCLGGGADEAWTSRPRGSSSGWLSCGRRRKSRRRAGEGEGEEGAAGEGASAA